MKLASRRLLAVWILLVAVLAVSVGQLGGVTASAATLLELGDRVGASPFVAQVTVGPQQGITAGQRRAKVPLRPVTVVEKVTATPQTTTVYNLTVTGERTYLVSSALADLVPLKPVAAQGDVSHDPATGSGGAWSNAPPSWTKTTPTQHHSWLLVHNNGCGDAANTGAKGFGALTKAGDYGVWLRRTLKADLKGTGLEAQHLIEQRFAGVMGESAGDMDSVAVTKAEHQASTNAWRQAIPYGEGTANATPAQIRGAASQIYANYPDILSALGLP